MDACALVRETEEDIKKIREKKKRVIQESVMGSNHEWPYQEKHFHIRGVEESSKEEKRLEEEEKILSSRKENAEKIRERVNVWMNTIPIRMQRIIRYKIFERMTWEQVAEKIGRGATMDSVRMEFKNFMEKK